jgi:hypothetical protein
MAPCYRIPCCTARETIAPLILDGARERDDAGPMFFIIWMSIA